MGLEPALRRDLAAAVRSKMSDLILNGDEATNAQEPDGFLTTIDAPTPIPPAVALYGQFAGSHALAVDGIHAMTENEVSSVIGVGSYQLAASVYDSGSGESGSEALKRRSRMCVASSYIPVPATSRDPRERARRQPVSRGGRSGRINARRQYRRRVADPRSDPRYLLERVDRCTLTWISLWDAQTAFRSAAYRRMAFRLDV